MIALRQLRRKVFADPEDVYAGDGGLTLSLVGDTVA